MIGDDANQWAAANRPGAPDPESRTGATARITLTADYQGNRSSRGAHLVCRCARLVPVVLAFRTRGGPSNIPRSISVTGCIAKPRRHAGPLAVRDTACNSAAFRSGMPRPGRRARIRVRCASSLQRTDRRNGVALQPAQRHSPACVDQSDVLTPDQVQTVSGRDGADGQPFLVRRVRLAAGARAMKSQYGAPAW
jgi:hypothetical protein